MEVLDEPLYANFLRVTGVDRPYREELLSNMVNLDKWFDYLITLLPLLLEKEIFVA
jgi:hypothetical protein